MNLIVNISTWTQTPFDNSKVSKLTLLTLEKHNIKHKPFQYKKKSIEETLPQNNNLDCITNPYIPTP